MTTLKLIRRRAWLLISLGLMWNGVYGAEHRTINLHQGEVSVLELKDIEDVAVGDESILSYAISDNEEFILFGKGVGQTDLYIWQRGNRETRYKVKVLSEDIAGEMALAKALAESVAGLKVKAEHNRMIFQGTIADNQEARLNAILSQFPNPVNLVTFRAFSERPVVRIDVTLLEVKRRALKDFGVDWDDVIAGPALGAHKTFARNDHFRIARGGPNGDGETNLNILTSVPNDHQFFGYGGLTSHIGSVINILVENGDAEVISAPKLMAKSGEEASFLSGGQFPVPVVGQLGQTEVEFKEYGVRLNIRPLVDDEGKINTFIFTELSSIDFANAVNGVPGVISRNSQTTINLSHGETFAISGLALAERSDQATQVPLLGDIPLLGHLFKSTNHNADSTELVIIVTPYIVTPDSAENTNLLSTASQIKSHFEGVDWETSIME